jgi:PadR family transcriptional regulator, regulatory protein PadR
LAAEQNVQVRPKKWLYPLILVVLQQENSSGYEIMERLRKEFGFEEISPGSVYRTLRQMEYEGLCYSEWEPLDGGNARSMYAITNEGEVFLSAWVEACEQYRRIEETLSRVYRDKTAS